jgi:hypothetical protein
MTYRYVANPYGVGDGFWNTVVGKALKFVVKNPVVGTALAVIPGGGIIGKVIQGVGKVMSSPIGKAAGAGLILAGAVDIAKNTFGPGVQQGAGVPPVPPPMQPTGGTATSPGGSWGPRGPGNKLQLPWNDPNVHASMKAFALDDSYLKVMYRAPRGYVVVRDPNGRPYPLQKWAALRAGWWHAARRPPITAGEWHQYQTALRVEKKLAKIARRALRKHGAGTGARRSGVTMIQESGPGSVKLLTHKRAA